MKNKKKWIRKLLKILLWTTVGIFGLLILLIFLIRIDSVQNYLITKITHSISEKTHTRVEIGRISIAFPKEIVLENVFLDDANKDTLLSAERIGIDVEMFALLSNKLNIGKISIDNLHANIHSTKTDSAFNYLFLQIAFAGDSIKTEKDTSSSPMMISIGDVAFTNINVNYNDSFGGTLINAKIGSLKTDFNDFNLLKNTFKVNELNLSDTYVELQSGLKENKSDTTSSILPDVGAENIYLKNIRLIYSDKQSGQKINLALGECKLKTKSVSLSDSKFDIASLDLRKTSLKMEGKKIPEVKADISENEKPSIAIKADKVNLSEVDYQMDYTNVVRTKEGFDPNHIKVSGLNSEIADVIFEPENISAGINTLSFHEQSGFQLNNLHTDFTFDNKHISLDNLKLETPGTKISDHISINFPSLKTISDSIGLMGIDVHLSGSHINLREITLLQPSLKSQPLFSGNVKTIYINTEIKGSINDIRIPDIMLTTGNTKLKAALSIRGLPDVEHSTYNVTIPLLTTTKEDLMAFLPGKLSGTPLPSSIYLSASFIGKLKNFNAVINLKSSVGNLDAKVSMEPGSENYTAHINAADVNLGLLLKDTLFGKANAVADINGNSFDIEKAKANLDINIKSLEVKKYNYESLKIKGIVSNQQFNGTAAMNDSNLTFNFDGAISLKKDSEQFAFLLDLKGINLKNLHFVDSDLRLSAKVNADLSGNSMNNYNGKAGISDMIVVNDGKSYTIDSVLFASVNESGKSSFSFSSAIMTAKFEGTFAPGEIGAVIRNEFNRYFDTGDTTTKKLSPQNFSFEVSVKDHPLLREVLLPGLEEFEPMKITGSLESEKNTLSLNVDVPKIKYSGTSINGLKFSLLSDANKIDYSVNLNEISNGSVKIIKTSIGGSISNDEAGINLLMNDTADQEKFLLKARLTSLREGDYHIAILPDGLSLNQIQWMIPKDNFIRFGKDGLLFNHFELSHDEQLISIHTPTQRINEEITFEFKNFQLHTFSQLIEKDSSFVAGVLNGKLQTKKVNNVSAFTADVNVDSLSIHSTPAGNIEIHADNNTPSRFNATLSLTGNDNSVNVKAYYLTDKNKPEINLSTEINSLNMMTISAFSGGQLSNAKGAISGNIKMTGDVSTPDIAGTLNFNDAGFHSAFANNYFTLKNEKLTFDRSGIYFSHFTLTDSLGNTAIVNGSIALNDFSISKFDLSLKLNNFVALNTNENDNKLFYGKLILNSDTKITGSLSLPKVNSKIRLIDGSYLTMVVPESKSTTDRGDGIVVFVDPKNKISPILTMNINEKETQAEIKGLDLYADLEIDKNSTLRILVDPASGDSLVLRGDATLSFGIDPSGKTSLTGTYTVSEGKYRVSLQDLVHQDFIIKNGSTINWNGDPLDAEINIDAIHEQRASPIDLVSGQIAGLSESEKNTYKQVLPFQIILHMTGALLKPTISFEIDLPPRYRGAMGGTVYAKLNQLNSDPSELNKQVFALLVLRRFVQEDPLASDGGGGGLNSVARASVSKFLSQQLNRFSDQYIKAVELNFDLQSYEDYSTGSAEAKTQLAVGLKKELFNSRLSFQVGSTVDLSKDRTSSRSNDIASDVTLEYKISKDGVYRAKAFRQNQYEDVIEGPLNVTGLGLIYTRDFDHWSDLFKREPEEETTIPLPKE